MEESECMMQSRFAKPKFRVLPLDDIDFTLITAFKRASALRSKTCVLIAVCDVKRRKVGFKEWNSDVCSISAKMLWGAPGENIRSAMVKSITLVDRSDDSDEIGVEFASDLVEFFDSKDGDPADVMGMYFEVVE